MIYMNNNQGLFHHNNQHKPHPRHAAQQTSVAPNQDARAQQATYQPQGYEQQGTYQPQSYAQQGAPQPGSYNQGYAQQTTYGKLTNDVHAPVPVMNAHTRSRAEADHGALADLIVPEARRAKAGYKRIPVTRRRAIAGIVAAAAVAGGWFMWSTRKVTIHVNDTPLACPAGAHLSDIVSLAQLSLNPGNFVAVDGSTLEEGKGEPFSVRIEDKDLSADEIKQYIVQGGEYITFADGADRMEDYDVEIEETQPKLASTGEAYGAVLYVAQWGKVGKTEIRHGKISGKTAKGDVIQEVQHCLIRKHNVKPDNDEKLVAVTFDDGPSNFTEKYLDILKQYGATTTFFNIGQNVDALRDLPPKVLEAGHHVAGHSYTHPQLSKLKPDALLSQLTKTKDSIEGATGVKTTMMRPPYGDFTMKTWLNTKGTISSEILWNQDTLDWKQPGVDKIISGALRQIVPGSIVLMHDGGGNRSQDVQALPKIFDELVKRGYKLVSIQELLASDSSIPKDIADGTATMPDDCVWPTELA